MEIYFLKRAIPMYTLNWRICSYHSSVFHGTEVRPETLRRKILPPAITNENREQMRISRSGRFVPTVFFQGGSLIVTDEVKTQLARLPGTDFLPVVFDRLVDVQLPSVGDFSWYGRITTPPGPDPDHELNTEPDIAEFHLSIGRYWEVLRANYSELDEKPLDVDSMEIDFGSYGGEPTEEVIVSPSLLQEFPFVWSGITQVREDAFAIIAPFLDLDYFCIARRESDTDCVFALEGQFDGRDE